MVVNNKFNFIRLLSLFIVLRPLKDIDSDTNAGIIILLIGVTVYLIVMLVLDLYFRKVVEVLGNSIFLRDNKYKKHKIELEEINSIKLESKYHEYYLFILRDNTKIKLKSNEWRTSDKIGFEEFFKDVLIKNPNPTTN